MMEWKKIRTCLKWLKMNFVCRGDVPFRPSLTKVRGIIVKINVKLFFFGEFSVVVGHTSTQQHRSAAKRRDATQARGRDGNDGASACQGGSTICRGNAYAGQTPQHRADADKRRSFVPPAFPFFFSAGRSLGNMFFLFFVRLNLIFFFFFVHMNNCRSLIQVRPVLCLVVQVICVSKFDLFFHLREWIDHWCRYDLFFD